MGLCVQALVLAVFFALPDAHAQALLDGRQVCELVPKARLEALFGGKEQAPAADFDPNTRVAICKRSFALPTGTFFVQLTVFEGGPFAEPPRKNFESGKASGKVVALPGLGDDAHRATGPVTGYMFLDVLHDAHVVAVIADYETKSGPSGRPIDETLQTAVIETVKETLARWPR